MEEEAKILLNKFHQGTATEEELELLEKWFLSFNADQPSKSSDAELEASALRSWSVVAAQTRPRGIREFWKPLSIAASVVLIAGAGLFYFSKQSAVQPGVAYSNDIAPGKMGATLTLANGKKIHLSDAANGELAKGAGVTISKSADGQVMYTASGETLDPATSGDNVHNIRNVLSTGKGETYAVVLPDGTKVWLNAASSLIYNTNMKVSKQRVVSLEGEGYFEVAKDKRHPFVVISGAQEVEVLGTHFNISAYKDDRLLKTVLLEGSVQVRSGSLAKVLKPNQQSTLSAGALKVDKVNAEDAVAWKNGLFVFEDEPLESIMNKLQRWYDVDVVYGDGVQRHDLYGGSVSRYDQISKVLKTLELTKDIHFKVEGRRVTVMR